MGNCDDVFASVFSGEVPGGCVDAVRRLVPTFAAGRRVWSGCFPVGARQSGMFFRYLGKVDAVPCAKMQLSQMRIMCQSFSITGDCVRSCYASAEVRGNDQRIAGKVGGKSFDLSYC